ncbi:MAG: hypothetical protein ACK481_05200 [Candidatus Melainabacteria bacterium]
MQIQQSKFQLPLLNFLKREPAPPKEAKSNTNSTANGSQSQTKVVYRAIKESEFIEFFKNKQNVKSLASKRFQDVQMLRNQYALESNENSQKVLTEVFAEISQGNLRDSADDHFFRAGNLLINELGFSNKDAVNFLFNLRIGLLYESGTW